MTEPLISFKGPGRCNRCDAPLPKGTSGDVCAACAAPAAEPGPNPSAAESAPGESTASEQAPAHEGHGHGGFHGHRLPPGEDPAWIDHPENVRKLIRIFWASCALILAVDLLDLLGVLYHKHPHYAVERLPGFYGIYGFVSCVALVLAAKLLRRGVMRGEDYYD